ncbi:hypothetical protein DFH07DRAFT_770086 [Mycena maculata]|uniref:Uncharacterized protein n=1 Tax=Mycena maculata TaxID=230809 RepID=A0AAD7JLV3_9AGAR|nr:hypothetical protein DFH07DRAFT_770086 [Mycena maculata]
MDIRTHAPHTPGGISSTTRLGSGQDTQILVQAGTQTRVAGFPVVADARIRRKSRMPAPTGSGIGERHRQRDGGSATRTTSVRARRKHTRPLRPVESPATGSGIEEQHEQRHADRTRRIYDHTRPLLVACHRVDHSLTRAGYAELRADEDADPKCGSPSRCQMPASPRARATQSHTFPLSFHLISLLAHHENEWEAQGEETRSAMAKSKWERCEGGMNGRRRGGGLEQSSPHPFPTFASRLTRDGRPPSLGRHVVWWSYNSRGLPVLHARCRKQRASVILPTSSRFSAFREPRTRRAHPNPSDGMGLKLRRRRLCAHIVSILPSTGRESSQEKEVKEAGRREGLEEGRAYIRERGGKGRMRKRKLKPPRRYCTEELDTIQT